MSFVKKGVVIGVGTNGEIDDAGVYQPNVVKLNNKYFCYYNCYDSSIIRIAVAISKDGIHFVKKGVAVTDGSGSDVDATHAFRFHIFLHNNKFYLYYIGVSAAGRMIALATSKDGIHFTKKGVVVPRGAIGEVDDANIDENVSINLINNKFYIYYGGNDGTNLRMCLAISKDGIHFTKKGVVLSLGAVGEIDDFGHYGIGVDRINNKFYMYYSGHDGSNIRPCFASSNDGLHFTKKGIIMPLGTNGNFDDTHNLPSSLFNNKKAFVFTSSDDGTLTRAGLAISKQAV